MRGLDQGQRDRGRVFKGRRDNEGIFGRGRVFFHSEATTEVVAYFWCYLRRLIWKSSSLFCCHILEEGAERLVLELQGGSFWC